MNLQDKFEKYKIPDSELASSQFVANLCDPTISPLGETNERGSKRQLMAHSPVASFIDNHLPFTNAGMFALDQITNMTVTMMMPPNAEWKEIRWKETQINALQSIDGAITKELAEAFIERLEPYAKDVEAESKIRSSFYNFQRRNFLEHLNVHHVYRLEHTNEEGETIYENRWRVIPARFVAPIGENGVLRKLIIKDERDKEDHDDTEFVYTLVDYQEGKVYEAINDGAMTETSESPNRYAFGMTGSPTDKPYARPYFSKFSGILNMLNEMERRLVEFNYLQTANWIVVDTDTFPLGAESLTDRPPGSIIKGTVGTDGNVRGLAMIDFAQKARQLQLTESRMRELEQELRTQTGAGLNGAVQYGVQPRSALEIARLSSELDTYISGILLRTASLTLPMHATAIYQCAIERMAEELNLSDSEEDKALARIATLPVRPEIISGTTQISVLQNLQGLLNWVTQMMELNAAYYMQRINWRELFNRGIRDLNLKADQILIPEDQIQEQQPMMNQQNLEQVEDAELIQARANRAIQQGDN